MTNKPIQKSLEVLKKEMLLSILSVKGVIYTYYENKKLTQGKYGNK